MEDKKLEIPERKKCGQFDLLVMPKPKFNYAMLHNGKVWLFKKKDDIRYWEAKNNIEDSKYQRATEIIEFDQFSV